MRAPSLARREQRRDTWYAIKAAAETAGFLLPLLYSYVAVCYPGRTASIGTFSTILRIGAGVLPDWMAGMWTSHGK